MNRKAAISNSSAIFRDGSLISKSHKDLKFKKSEVEGG